MVLGSKHGSGPQALGHQSLRLGPRHDPTIPRSPRTTITAAVLVLPAGCLKYLGTEQVKGVSKNKEILNPKTLCISQKLGARKRPSELPHQHAAVHHTCSLAERALELNEFDLACLAGIQ